MVSCPGCGLPAGTQVFGLDGRRLEPEKHQPQVGPSRRRSTILTAAVTALVVLAGVGVGIWWFTPRSQQVAGQPVAAIQPSPVASASEQPTTPASTPSALPSASPVTAGGAPPPVDLSASVVRVLSTSCGGLGVATGWIWNDQVITSELAVRGAFTVVVVTDQGSIRAVPTSVGGHTAVLKPVTPLHRPGLTLADHGVPSSSTVQIETVSGEDAGVPRQFKGRFENGRLISGTDVDTIGSPVLGSDNTVVGMLAEKNAEEVEVNPVESFSALLTGTPQPPAKPSCSAPRGPSNGIVPVGGDVDGTRRDVLEKYFTAINQQDFTSAWMLFSPKLAARNDFARTSAGWTGAYNYRIDTQSRGDTVRVSFDSISPPNGMDQPCARWTIDYGISGGMIDSAKGIGSPVPCQ